MNDVAQVPYSRQPWSADPAWIWTQENADLLATAPLRVDLRADSPQVSLAVRDWLHKFATPDQDGWTCGGVDIELVDDEDTHVCLELTSSGEDTYESLAWVAEKLYADLVDPAPNRQVAWTQLPLRETQWRTVGQDQVRTFTVTMDAADPLTLGQFWAAALGYVPAPPPEPHHTWEQALRAWGLPPAQWNSAYAIVDPTGAGPRIFFQQVSEHKQAKNRVHLDVHSGAGAAGNKDMAFLRALASELEELGATVVAEFAEAFGQWIVMTDPEGNEFCVV